LLMDQVVSHPSDFGLDVVDRACLIPGATGQVSCNNRTGYLFWDGQHPTRKGHSLIAAAARQLLAE